jgi:hypothetical protein
MTQQDFNNSLLFIQSVLNNDLVPALNTLQISGTVATDTMNIIVLNENVIIDDLNDLISALPTLKGDQGLKGDTGLKGDNGPQGLQGLAGISAPLDKYAHYNWSGTIPASGSNLAFLLSHLVSGNLGLSSGSIFLPAGYAYDIEVRASPIFSAVGVFQYNIMIGTTASRLFQVVPVENTAYTYPINSGGRILIDKLSVDSFVTIRAMTRTGCTALASCDLLIRSINV